MAAMNPFASKLTSLTVAITKPMITMTIVASVFSLKIVCIMRYSIAATKTRLVDLISAMKLTLINLREIFPRMMLLRNKIQKVIVYGV